MGDPRYSCAPRWDGCRWALGGMQENGRPCVHQHAHAPAAWFWDGGAQPWFACPTAQRPAVPHKGQASAWRVPPVAPSSWCGARMPPWDAPWLAFCNHDGLERDARLRLRLRGQNGPVAQGVGAVLSPDATPRDPPMVLFALPAVIAPMAWPGTDPGDRRHDTRAAGTRTAGARSRPTMRARFARWRARLTRHRPRTGAQFTAAPTHPSTSSSQREVRDQPPLTPIRRWASAAAAPLPRAALPLPRWLAIEPTTAHRRADPPPDPASRALRHATPERAPWLWLVPLLILLVLFGVMLAALASVDARVRRVERMVLAPPSPHPPPPPLCPQSHATLCGSENAPNHAAPNETDGHPGGSARAPPAVARAPPVAAHRPHPALGWLSAD